MLRFTICFNNSSFTFSGKDTKNEIKAGIRHWKRALKGCLKFIRLDRKPEKEALISKEYFDGGPVEHILFTKTDTG